MSTKSDAKEAYNQALVAVWNEEDTAACDKYTALIDEAQEHAAELRKLTDHHHISVLKNSKGNLTLKAIKDRLAFDGRQDRAEDAQQVPRCRQAAEGQEKKMPPNY